MTLPNTANIADVISALSDMQAINQKSELATVIGSPTTTSDNMATQITNLQTAKNIFATKLGVPNNTPIKEMADNMQVGKKWASGTTNASTETKRFQYSGNSTIVNRRGLTVTGLSFTPSTIIIKATETSGLTYIASYSSFDSVVRAASYSEASNNTNSLSIKPNAEDGYINSTGFCLPGAETILAHTWIAYA